MSSPWMKKTRFFGKKMKEKKKKKKRKKLEERNKETPVYQMANRWSQSFTLLRDENTFGGIFRTEHKNLRKPKIWLSK